jgi:polysaccharide export outer membrane protein
MRCLVPVLLLTACDSAQQAVPNRAISVPEVGANLPAQPVGANDLIAVSVYDAPELSRTVRIGGDGFIRLPMLKQQLGAGPKRAAQVTHSIAMASLANDRPLLRLLDFSSPRVRRTATELTTSGSTAI